ncbi:endonuclease MutS2 [Trichlorobacter ammonificans]|uniref:Endonuclease MutS2 n=1 Tax=Trichlorobacter ammonificans TaxID=2916410 RepID=A0ABM9DBY2_9BACT|nr:endonuclease MutS2 [Trichlorobacter ammonificans]CAH2031881.1 Endonuclease MutS2 [Trichlorobacter ammonificans]
MIPTDTLLRLEFDKVLQAVARHARSRTTAAAVAAMAPLRDSTAIRTHWGRIEEIRGLARQRISLSIGRFDDIRPLLDEVRPDGAILAPLSLLQFIPVLESLAALARQLAPRQDIPLLRSIDPQPEAMDDILEPLSATLDDEGNILDSASRELAEIRRAKRTLAARVRRKLEEIVRKHETAIFLQDDFITIRSGRWVIPVRMDSKGMVPGVVHDVSSSGETAFMEPLEIIPFVNELENLTAEEKAEEIRILRRLSAWIREDADRIAACFGTLVELDRLDCLAAYAERFAMAVPELSDDGRLRLLSARHPLLLSLRADQPDAPPVVPLEIELTTGTETPERETSQVIVISGPNAGGKTIALKTVGLITLMALSGMAIPASPSSTVPLLDHLLVDMGDEQSIEQSLSTFSAHAAAMARILGQADQRSLVLLDELGTGTEPLQGAAIGCAVLNELRRRGALVIATTHLTEIVGFVQRTPAMRNAGMEFDSSTWTPRYRLVMGEPGQSHALETARRYGLPEPVLAFARELLGDSGTAFAGVIDELRVKRDHLATELAGLQAERARLATRERELEQQRGELEELRRTVIEQGRDEARAVVTATRRELNALLDDLRKERRKETADKLRNRAAQLEAAFAPSGQAPPSGDSLKPGDRVHVRSLGRDAQVVSVDSGRNKVRVRAGSIELEVPLHGLMQPAAPAPSARERKAPRFKAAAWTAEETPSAAELNLIGKRVDDALTELEGFIDQAVLAGQRQVRIVHGMGSGALQRAVREFLGRHPQVASFRAGEPHEGRDGATVAELE